MKYYNGLSANNVSINRVEQREKYLTRQVIKKNNLRKISSELIKIEKN
jgi:hypothetical protein